MGYYDKNIGLGLSLRDNSNSIALMSKALNGAVDAIGDYGKHSYEKSIADKMNNASTPEELINSGVDATRMTDAGAKAYNNRLVQLKMLQDSARQKVLDGYAKTQNDHANTLYNEKQDEYNRKVHNRDILNTVAQNPDIANANNIGKTQTDALIQNHFAQGNAAAEAKIKALGLDANNGDGEQIGKIYDQANYGTTDPIKIDLINRKMQGEYDNNKLTREDGKKLLERQIVTAGGDLTDPSTQAYIKDTIVVLPTRASLVAADAKAADAANKAAQKVIKNRIEFEKLGVAATKANNTGLSRNSNGSKQNSRYYRGHLNSTQFMKALDALGDRISPNASIFGIPLNAKLDATHLKNASAYLTSKGVNGNDILNFMNGQLDFGGWGNTNSAVVNDFDKGDPKTTTKLDHAFNAYMMAKNKAASPKGGGTAADRATYTVPSRKIIQYIPQRGMSYPEIQAAQDKASADRIAALFGAPAKTVKKSGGTKTKGSNTGGTSDGTKKVLKTDGGTDKPILAPAIQLGSADRLQEMADAKQADGVNVNDQVNKNQLTVKQRVQALQDKITPNTSVKEVKKLEKEAKNIQRANYLKNVVTGGSNPDFLSPANYKKYKTLEKGIISTIGDGANNIMHTLTRPSVYGKNLFIGLMKTLDDLQYNNNKDLLYSPGESVPGRPVGR